MPGKRKGTAKSSKAQQRLHQRQQSLPADAPKTILDPRREPAEHFGDPSLGAKKKDLERAVDLARVQYDESTGRTAGECRHGYTPPLSRDCGELVEACLENAKDAEGTWQLVGDIHSLMKNKFQRVWANAIHRKSIKAWAVSRGISTLQVAVEDRSNSLDVYGKNSVFYATLILCAENYNHRWDEHKEACVELSITRRTNVLLQGSLRATVKFFIQRAHCSCLETLYAEVKSRQDKLGECNFCGKTTSVRELWVCTRCNCIDYCSKDCQAAHWPEHKKSCDFIKRNNLQLVALSKPTKALTPFLNGPTRS